MHRFRLLIVPLAFALAAGCAGRGEDASGSGGSGSTTGTGGSGSTTGDGSTTGGATDGGTVLQQVTGFAPVDPCGSSPIPGPRKLWRLTAPAFAASIHAIFNDTSNSAPIETVFSDPVTLGFSIDAETLLVQGLNASQLEDNAEAIAAWAASNNQLSQFASCASSTSGAPSMTCATQFVQAFGRRAFRTTLDSSDPRVASYATLFMSGSSNSDGAQIVIEAMLQSPYFLYRSELGVQNGNTFTLTPYEVASELSYLLTGNMPSDALLTAADAVANGTGGATISSMIAQQVQGLLSTGATTAVMGFMNGWLGLPRLYTTAHDNTVFMLSTALQNDMATESQDLIMEAFNNGGSFGDVLTADHSWLNADLATFYGISTNGLSSGSFTSVKYAGVTPRDPGLLATGTILNGYARPDTDSPTQRGHLVRSRLLCQDIPPPPAGVNTTFTPPSMPETTRQQFELQHSGPGDGGTPSTCYGCHQLMDWIGFAFENYDGWGRYRTTDNGLPVDDTATIYSDPEKKNVNVTGLSGASGLSAYLAQSDEVRRCMQRYWTYYAYGSSTWTQDGCTYDAIYNEAQSNNFGLQSTLMAIIHAPNFTSRVQDQ